MKKLFTILLCLLMLIPFSSCGNSEESFNYEVIDDKYRTYYEIYVASFYDSDGDGCGDLNGITEKLDYIQEMGYTGIWLMPIHKSPSYHKYDVMDYYSIDEDYGTIEDFQNLIEEAHNRDIVVIMDLVVNHTSNLNTWFAQAAKAFSNGTDSEYIDWYNFSDTAQVGYAYSDYGCYYEARFSDSMPDLNLDNEEVRNEIVNIMQYWLDLGVDGFRLDATTSYYTSDNEANIEFLSWIKEEADSIYEDCYIVGECWESDSIIQNYYTSGVDSFFQFSLSQAEGKIANLFKTSSPAAQYKTIAKDVIAIAGDGIPAVFLGNHDTNRIAGAIGRTNISRIKFAYGLTAMLNGTVWTYYGDEIGMVGSGIDENKRIAMLWDDTDTTGYCDSPEDATKIEYAYSGVNEQLDDEDSILNYYKAINLLRLQYPEIARGELSFENLLCDSKQVVMYKTWNDNTICIVINFNESDSITVDLSEYDYNTMDYVSTSSENSATFEEGILTLPPQTIAILDNVVED